VRAESSAEAGLREARVSVRRAELDLERTEIRAPFVGRVREKHVDIGQFLSRGAAVARLYAVDYAEVRLPINDGDLAYLELPVGFRAVRAETESAAARDAPDVGKGADASTPSAPAPVPATEAAADVAPERVRVTLSAEFGGKRHSWPAYVARTEGALDRRTRMLTVVARIDDPYARRAESKHAPLPIGLFVEARIEGRHVESAFEIPRSSLRRESEVLVVDTEDRIHVRRVEVLRADRDRCWIRSGLAEGERVVVSTMDVVTEGMKVRPSLRTTAGQNAAADFYRDRDRAPARDSGRPG